MLTTSWLTQKFGFQPEFVSDENLGSNQGFDLSIQQIDAPIVIAAGSHIRVSSHSIDGFEYGLPSAIVVR